jgi:hypothetical protein
VLSAVPAAIAFIGAVGQERDAGPRQAGQVLGGMVVVAFAASHGLVAIAMATVGWGTVVALASAWPLWRGQSAAWRAALFPAVRPCAGAAAAGFLLVKLADPIGLALPAMPALCLLIALGWLLYLAVRGGPIGTTHPLPSTTLTAPVVDG